MLLIKLLSNTKKFIIQNVTLNFMFTQKKHESYIIP